MNALIASILGRGPVREDATSVPVPAIAQRAKSRRERARAHRTVAAILGMSEAEEEEELIPDDAVEIDNILGAPGVDVDDRASQVAKAPTEPALPNYGQGSPEPLMTPAVALVAPDVTPEALKPLDASQVPKGDQPIAAQPMAPEPIQPEDESDPLHKILAMAGLTPRPPRPPIPRCHPRPTRPNPCSRPSRPRATPRLGPPPQSTLPCWSTRKLTVARSWRHSPGFKPCRHGLDRNPRAGRARGARSACDHNPRAVG
jgi:hypothetical protein